MSDCSSSIGASATLLCLTDQAEESGVWVKERSIVVAQSAEVRQRRCRRPARVKGHCSHATAEAQSCWAKSIRVETKIALFCLHPSVVLFIYTFARACAFVETQLTQAFQCPGISTLTASGVNRADTPLCPHCIRAVVTIEQWENAVKVALKERYSNLRAPESGAADRTQTGGVGPRQQVLGAGVC